MGSRHPTHHSRAVRHQTDRERGLHQAVQHYKTIDASRRRHRELRRCGTGRRTDTAVGDATRTAPLPCATVVDFVDDRRSYQGGIRQPETTRRLPVTLRGWPMPRHRRLAARHERHTALYLEIPTGTTAGVLHRPRADPHAGHDCEKANGNRQLQTGTVLGAIHHLPRHPFYPETV